MTAQLLTTDWIDWLVRQKFQEAELRMTGFRMFFAEIPRENCPWAGMPLQTCAFVPLLETIDPMNKVFRSGFETVARLCSITPRQLWIELTDEQKLFRFPFRSTRIQIFDLNGRPGQIVAVEGEVRLVFFPHYRGNHQRLVITQIDRVVEQLNGGRTLGNLIAQADKIHEWFSHPIVSRLEVHSTLIVGA